MYDNRVVIVNPGGAQSGITKANFGKESIRRNLIIADLFHRMGKVERIGSGIGKMISLVREADLKEPVFEMETFFRVIFYCDPKYSLNREGIEEDREKGLVEGLVENHKKILELVKNNPRMSKKDLSKKIGISTPAIDKNIISLKKKNLLKRIGPAKGGYWEVIEG